ncbi:hypothetical protein DYB36_001700 [Aphanomyces astaci]|uniref:Uncharacterized protein n=1 Tax=Aphanomyces astaci TaxID=112090 RepID=A0A397AYR2_APHAT|nr:hypothetical protein DYB36_001700 [Aphanomyces astaci]
MSFIRSIIQRITVDHLTLDMLRQLYNIVFTGGFTRVGTVQVRLAENFSVPVVDKLMADRVIQPKNTSRAMCIITTACVPEAAIDLRDFRDGSKHALQLTLAHVFSPSMVDFAVNRPDEAISADTYLQTTCTPRLHKSLIAFCAKQAKKNDGLVIPQPITECIISDGSFNVDDDDHSETVALTVVCSLPYTNEPYENEGNAAELEQRIVAASDKDIGTAKDIPAESAKSAAESPNTGGTLYVAATFRSAVDGEMDWILEDLKITGTKPIKIATKA